HDRYPEAPLHTAEICMPSSSDPVPVSMARRIDAVCDRFETEWKAGRRPHIEDHLGNATGPARAELLRALLELELELQGRDQPPDAAAYRARFPADGSVIDAALASAAQKTAAYRAQQASLDTAAARTSRSDAPPPAPGKPAAPMPGRIGRFEVLER